MTYDPQGLGEQFAHQADMFGYVPAMTQCNFCGDTVPLVSATITKLTMGDMVLDTEHYCCDAHALIAFRQRGQ